MRSPVRPAVLTGLALVLVLVAGSCSDGDGGTGPPPSTGGTTTSSTPRGTTGVITAPTSTSVATTSTAAPTTRPTSPPTTAGGTIRSMAFGELVLAADSCGPVFAQPPVDGYPLHGGEARSGNPGDDGYYSVSVRPDPAIGDLDGDGQEDAVILVDCSTGTTPITFAWAYAPDAAGRVRRLGGFRLDPGRSEQLDTFGDPRLQGVALEGSTVVTMWATHQSGDPICCPTGQTSVRFTWAGSAFAVSS
jgi:hypothetical protein